MKKRIPASRPYQDWLIERLRNKPAFAAEYLRGALEDDDEPPVLTASLRNLVQSRGGMARIARKIGVTRASLERSLSGSGNLRASTLSAIIRALGFEIVVKESLSVGTPKRKSA